MGKKLAVLWLALAGVLGFAAHPVVIERVPTVKIHKINDAKLLVNSVFKVETEMVEKENDGLSSLGWSAGTAFFVDRGFLGVGLMTAWHVVESSPSQVTVYGPTESVVCDFTHLAGDIAWSRLLEYPSSWIPLPVKNPHYGGDVCAWGFPNESKLSMACGILKFRQTTHFHETLVEGGDYVAVTVTIDRGFSGGPVIGEDGSVVGVIVVGSRFGPVRSFMVLIPNE